MSGVLTASPPARGGGDACQAEGRHSAGERYMRSGSVEGAHGQVYCLPGRHARLAYDCMPGRHQMRGRQLCSRESCALRPALPMPAVESVHLYERRPER